MYALKVFSICSNDLSKPIVKYIYVSKKHLFRCCPTAKHPKHYKLQVTSIRKRPADSFYGTQLALNSAQATILLTQVFLQKFLSSIIYNSLISGCICWKLWRYRVAVVSQLPLNGSLLFWLGFLSQTVIWDESISYDCYCN